MTTRAFAGSLWMMLATLACAREAPTGPATAATAPSPSASTSTSVTASVIATTDPTTAGAPKTTVVTGVAHDVKGGAAVFGDDGQMTRIGGLDRWPPELAGHRVVAEGTMTKVSGPGCASDPTLPCQGIVGDYWVLADARYHLE